MFSHGSTLRLEPVVRLYPFGVQGIFFSVLFNLNLPESESFYKFRRAVMRIHLKRFRVSTPNCNSAGSNVVDDLLIRLRIEYPIASLFFSEIFS